MAGFSLGPKIWELGIGYWELGIEVVQSLFWELGINSQASIPNSQILFPQSQVRILILKFQFLVPIFEFYRKAQIPFPNSQNHIPIPTFEKFSNWELGIEN